LRQIRCRSRRQGRRGLSTQDQDLPGRARRTEILVIKSGQIGRSVFRIIYIMELLCWRLVAWARFIPLAVLWVLDELSHSPEWLRSNSQVLSALLPGFAIAP